VTEQAVDDAVERPQPQRWLAGLATGHNPPVNCEKQSIRCNGRSLQIAACSILVLIHTTQIGCATLVGQEDRSNETTAKIGEASIETFLRAYDRAIIVGDRDSVINAFDRNASITVVGPPPDSVELSYTIDKMVQMAIESAADPDYGRARTIENIVVDPERSEVITRSTLKEYFKITDGRDLYVRYIESTTLIVKDSQILIDTYHLEMPEPPVAF
jgi:hypothetical protein